MVKSHDELTEGYWFFRRDDEVTIVQVVTLTRGGVPVPYVMWVGIDRVYGAKSLPIDWFIGPVPMPSAAEPQAWQKLDNAFSNFVNCYSDPFEPKLKHESEVSDRIKTLYEEFNNYRTIRKTE